MCIRDRERIESRGTYEAEKQELDTELAAAATEKETAAEQLRNIQEEIARCTCLLYTSLFCVIGRKFPNYTKTLRGDAHLAVR